MINHVMSENRIIWAGVATFAIWLLCMLLLFSGGMASDALFIIGIPTLAVAAPFSRWYSSIKSGKKSKFSGLLFLLLMQLVTLIFGLFAVWAYSGRNSVWLNFWPESQIAQVSGYIAMVLPVVVFVISVLYLYEAFAKKRRSN